MPKFVVDRSFRDILMFIIKVIVIIGIIFIAIIVVIIIFVIIIINDTSIRVIVLVIVVIIIINNSIGSVMVSLFILNYYTISSIMALVLFMVIGVINTQCAFFDFRFAPFWGKNFAAGCRKLFSIEYAIFLCAL